MDWDTYLDYVIDEQDLISDDEIRELKAQEFDYKYSCKKEEG